jgi:hypothetical protein
MPTVEIYGSLTHKHTEEFQNNKQWAYNIKRINQQQPADSKIYGYIIW